MHNFESKRMAGVYYNYVLNEELLHAKLGACFANLKYGVADPEILSAITWHTTGKPDMSLLDKIVYVADYL